MYRFIYYHLSPEVGKDKLDFIVASDERLSKREMRWRQKYITFKEAKLKLENHPFELTEPQAI